MRASRPTRGDTAIAIALVLAGIVVWKLRMLDPASVAYRPLGNADFYLQIYPMAHRAADWLRHGVLPLWNPYQFAGHPFLATGIYGVAYPPNAAYLFLPTRLAMEVTMVAHLVAAGVFTYWYCRAIELDRAGATAAALTYMLSGFLMLEGSWFPPAIAAAAWLPLALLAVERIAAGGSVAWVAALAAGLALPFLAGWPQTWIYALYATALYALARIVVAASDRVERAHLARTTLLLGCGFAAALGLIAVQLLPSLELQRLGPRQAGALSARQITVIGPPSADSLMSGMLGGNMGTRQWYLGIAPLLMAPLALLSPAGTRPCRGIRRARGLCRRRRRRDPSLGGLCGPSRPDDVSFSPRASSRCTHSLAPR